MSLTRKELRKKSYAEALEVLRAVVKQGMEDKVKKPVRSFFGKKRNHLGKDEA